jgi:hypothetical protein
MRWRKTNDYTYGLGQAPYGSRRLRFPEFLENRYKKVAKFAAHVTSPVLTFVTGWVDPMDMVRPRRIKPIKYPNDLHRNSNPRPSGLWRNRLRHCPTNRKTVFLFKKEAVRFVRKFFKIMKSDGLLSSSQKPLKRHYP